MTQFRFRLQSLLKLRMAERDSRREELANAYRADQVLEQRQAALEQEIAEAQRQAKEHAAPGTIHVDRLLNAHRYELVLQAQHQQLARQRQLIAAEIDRRRQALVEADREVRVLEKLREKHAAEYAYREQRADTNQLDEIALRRIQAHWESNVR